MIRARINTAQYTNFSYIFRTDTNYYTEEDVKKEIGEWRQILTNLLGFQTSYYIDRVTFSSRLTSTLAKTGRGYIVVNEGYLRHHGNSDNFHNTLAHETIHTLQGCFNHGENFKWVGRRLASLYDGVTITRTRCDAGYIAWKNQHKPHVEKPIAYKYKIVCEKCGQTFYRQRLSSIVKNPNNFRCGKCYGKFKIFEIMPDGTEIQRIFVTL